MSQLLNSRIRGFTITEVLLSFGILTAVAAATFSGQINLMLASSRDEVFQDVRESVLLAMDHIRRDVYLSSNIYPTIGGQGNTRTTGDHTLVLRQPVVNNDDTISTGQFQYVCYTIEDDKKGLIRQVWDDVAYYAPSQTTMINEDVMEVGFLYGGAAISAVTDSNLVNEIVVILISGQSLGVSLPDAENLTIEDVSERTHTNDLGAFGLSMGNLSSNLNTLNAEGEDYFFSTSIGVATMRNHRDPLMLQS